MARCSIDLRQWDRSQHATLKPMCGSLSPSPAVSDSGREVSSRVYFVNIVECIMDMSSIGIHISFRVCRAQFFPATVVEQPDEVILPAAVELATWAGQAEPEADAIVRAG
jgi:hypothetical protein